MSATQQILIYVIETIGGLYVFFALLRFFLQLSRADYYNPVSQFSVKITQLPVSTLGKVIPSWGTVDFASLTWVLIVQLIIIEVAALSVGFFVPITTAISWAAIGTLNLALTMIFWGMIIVIVLSFAALLGGGIISHPILDLLRQMMAPIMMPLQRLIPPMGGLDFFTDHFIYAD